MVQTVVKGHCAQCPHLLLPLGKVSRKLRGLIGGKSLFITRSPILGALLNTRRGGVLKELPNVESVLSRCQCFLMILLNCVPKGEYSRIHWIGCVVPLLLLGRRQSSCVLCATFCAAFSIVDSEYPLDLNIFLRTSLCF